MCVVIAVGIALHLLLLLHLCCGDHGCGRGCPEARTGPEPPPSVHPGYQPVIVAMVAAPGRSSEEQHT